MRSIPRATNKSTPNCLNFQASEARLYEIIFHHSNRYLNHLTPSLGCDYSKSGYYSSTYILFYSINISRFIEGILVSYCVRRKYVCTVYAYLYTIGKQN